MIWCVVRTLHFSWVKIVVYERQPENLVSPKNYILRIAHKKYAPPNTVATTPAGNS
nr:hypothetical protein [Alysiella crassa]UOP06500.1 hypothetical protein LVJ80_12165 [Alysiella crassa]